MRAKRWLVLAVCTFTTVPAKAQGLGQPEATAVPPAAAEEKAPVEDIPAPKSAVSKVTAVTVYPTTALVTREVAVPEGKGAVRVVVTPLPAETLAGSLYGEAGDGLRILSTRFRTRAVRDDTRKDVRAKEDQIKTLKDEAVRLKAGVGVAEQDLKFLQKLEDFTGATLHGLTDKGKLDVEATISLSKYVMTTRAGTSTAASDAELKVQANAHALEFAQRELAELSAGTVRTESDAVIDLDKAENAAGTVRLNYLVGASSWKPRYRIRAGGEKDPVRLETLGAIEQRSGEDWDDARITLSTSQPSLNAVPPELIPWNLTISEDGEIASATDDPSGTGMMGGGLGGGMAGMGGGILPPAVRKPATDPVIALAREARERAALNRAAARDQAHELLAGDADADAGEKDREPGKDHPIPEPDAGAGAAPTVTFLLKGRLTIPSSKATQVVEVARTEMAPDYFFKTVPILSPSVFRLATLTNNGAHVLLPGEATIYVGDDFVGRMALPIVAVGEPFTVGLGVDPQIQVYRRLQTKSGTVQGANQVHSYAFRIAVRSFKPRPVKLQVWDRLPRAEAEAVAVKLTGTTPELSDDKVYGRTARRDNLLRWDLDLKPTAPGADPQQILYQFQLEYARGVILDQIKAGGLHEAPMGGGMGGMGGFQ